MKSEGRPMRMWSTGNTVVKLFSVLPFLSDEEHKQLFEDKGKLPELQNFKRIWAELLIENELRKRSIGDKQTKEYG